MFQCLSSRVNSTLMTLLCSESEGKKKESEESLYILPMVSTIDGKVLKKIPASYLNMNGSFLINRAFLVYTEIQFHL